MKGYNHFLSVLILTFLPIIAFAESSAHALGAHVHGVATLQVVVDNKTLTIMFSSPLDNVLGFERKPRNKAEVKQVQNMINQFYKKTVFVPTPYAQCKMKNVDLQSLVIKKKPSAPTQKHEEHEEHAGHADLDAELTYTCNNIKKLRDLQVNLFKPFPNLHQLNTEIVSERGQTAVKLSPSQSQAVW